MRNDIYCMYNNCQTCESSKNTQELQENSPIYILDPRLVEENIDLLESCNVENIIVPMSTLNYLYNCNMKIYRRLVHIIETC